MSRAMQDLLDSTLGSWYAYLSSWQAPGVLSHTSCSECVDSPFLNVAGVRDWPHDIAHELVRGLSTAVRHVHVSLEELDERVTPAAQQRVERNSVLARHAQALILAGIAPHEFVMRDVLEQCVAPSLDEYLRSECERGILDLFGVDRT